MQSATAHASLATGATTQERLRDARELGGDELESAAQAAAIALLPLTKGTDKTAWRKAHPNAAARTLAGIIVGGAHSSVGISSRSKYSRGKCSHI